MSTYKGVKHIDGGFSDNLPIFDEHTVRICCFSGPSDISPSDRAKMELLSANILNTPLYLTFSNFRRFRKALFPPPASFIVDLLERGFHDTKDFILSNDLIQCDTCYGRTDIRDQPIYNKISPTITPSVTPSVSRSCSFTNLNNFKTSSKQTSGPLLKPTNSTEGLLSANLDTEANQKSFSNQLHNKLRSFSPDSNISCISSVSKDSEAGRDSGLGTAPIIIVESSDETNCKSDSGSDGESFSKSSSASSSSNTSYTDEQQKSEKVSPNRLALRRNTVQDNQLLVIKDKFKFASSSLPSCPPSPNLNRHCTECIRMRQEARMDLIEEEIRREAEKYRQVTRIKDNSFKSKLTSPLRWFRQIGVKSSYKFNEN